MNTQKLNEAAEYYKIKFENIEKKYIALRQKVCDIVHEDEFLKTTNQTGIQQAIDCLKNNEPSKALQILLLTRENTKL